MQNLLIKNSKVIIALFVIYLALCPTPIVTSGLFRLFPTIVLMVFSILGLMSLNGLKGARVGMLLVSFVVFITLNTIFTKSAYGNSFITLIKSTFWVWTYCISYTIFKNSIPDSKTYNKWVLLVSILMMSVFYIYNRLRLMEIGDEEGDNMIFYSILLIPWVSCIHSNKIKWTIILVLSLCTLLSLKRSATIILVSSVVIIFVSDFILNRKIRVTTLLSGLIIAVSLVGVLNFADERVATIVNRFESIEDDGGSGRDAIYKDVYLRYGSGTLDQKIFGRGFDGVRRDSTYYVPVSAHNDFLEVLYDFGIIGFVLYILIHLSLIKWVLRSFRARSQLAYPVLVSYVCFLVMSMVSHLILYPTYFGLLTAFWAYAECKDRELKFQMKLG